LFKTLGLRVSVFTSIKSNLRPSSLSTNVYYGSFVLLMLDEDWQFAFGK